MCIFFVLRLHSVVRRARPTIEDVEIGRHGGVEPVFFFINMSRACLQPIQKPSVLGNPTSEALAEPKLFFCVLAKLNMAVIVLSAAH